MAFRHSLILSCALASLGAPVALAASTPDTFAPCPPYLQDGRPGQVTLVWRPVKPTTTHVVVKDDFGHAVFDQHVPGAAQVQVEVKGLSPGRTYTYDVQEPGQPSHQASFTVNRAANATHLRFAVVGDMGDGSPAQFAVARQMTAWNPEFLVTVGDNIYPNGSAKDFGPKFFEPYRDILSHAVCYPVLGNHDVHTENGAPYLKAFVLPQDPAKGRYYAFDEGPARFYALDSNESLLPGSPQYEWLAADAAASQSPWKIAVFHHPPYSSGLHGQEARNRRWLPPLFSRLGFQLVLTGHDHHYERSVPIGGVTYIVTGGGGAKLYGTTEQPFTAYKAVRHEFLGVSIYKDRLGLMAIDDRGQRLDAATITLDDARR